MRLDELTLTELVETLPTWSAGQRISVVLMAWLVFGLGFFFLSWQGSLDSNSQLDSEIRAALSRLNTQSEMLRERPEVEAELASLETQLPVLKQALPSERELASLLERINAMILDYGLRLAEFTPQEPMNQEVMRVVPVTLSVRGDGGAIAQLPNHIATLTRQVRLQNFEMSILPAGGSWVLKGELNAFAQLPPNLPNQKEGAGE